MTPELYDLLDALGGLLYAALLWPPMAWVAAAATTAWALATAPRSTIGDWFKALTMAVLTGLAAWWSVWLGQALIIGTSTL